MAENPKRISTEETWATALAVIGGLAVLVPLIVFALGRQPNGGGVPAVPPAAVGGTAETPVGVGTGERPKLADLPVPTSASELRRELVEARKQIDALGVELSIAQSTSEANRRSAQRAWIQLREAAGEPDENPDEKKPPEGENPS